MLELAGKFVEVVIINVALLQHLRLIWMGYVTHKLVEKGANSLFFRRLADTGGLIDMLSRSNSGAGFDKHHAPELFLKTIMLNSLTREKTIKFTEPLKHIIKRMKNKRP